jgi:hypothetical protein
MTGLKACTTRGFMIWLNPLALFALAVIAAPILIHILVQRRAERFSFPTLRFLQPTRLAAIRRHLLEDAMVLAVRAAILAAAVAALAAPLIVTAARRQAWERRIVRAIVEDDDVAAASAPEALRRGPAPRSESAGSQPESPPPYRMQQFTAASLQDGIRRAVAWLDTAPPARRELLVFSTFAIGSITEADVEAIPTSIGIRFERRGELPQTRTISDGRVISSESFALRLVAREVTFAGALTRVREVATSDAPAWAIDVVHAPDAKAAVDAAKAAVLGQRVWMPLPDRRVRLVIGTSAGIASVLADVAAMSQPWMADAIARIARDGDLNAAGARVAAGLSDARFMAAPWHTVTSAADGRPLAIAAGSPGRLIVVSAASASDLVTPLLMRSIANAVAGVPNLQRAEVVPISDRLLREWSRPAGVPAAPRIDALEQGREDDRRWFWLAALCLLAIEMWVRRASAAAAPGDSVDREEAARVA